MWQTAIAWTVLTSEQTCDLCAKYPRADHMAKLPTGATEDSQGVRWPYILQRELCQEKEAVPNVLRSTGQHVTQGHLRWQATSGRDCLGKGVGKEQEQMMGKYKAVGGEWGGNIGGVGDTVRQWREIQEEDASQSEDRMTGECWEALSPSSRESGPFQGQETQTGPLQGWSPPSDITERAETGTG